VPRTVELPRSTAVAIIGGGIMGLSTAWHLARRGQRDITVFEAETVGAGASGRTGALLRQHYTNRPETHLAHWSLDLFRRWPDLVDPVAVHTPAPLVVTVPIAPANDVAADTNMDRLRRNITMQRAVGVQTRIVTPDELRALQPHARTDDLRAVALEADSGYVDAPAAVRALALACRRLGVRFIEQTAVSSVVVAGERVQAIVVDGQRVATEHVVCAAGAHTPALTVTARITLPITALRVQIAILIRPLHLEPAHFAYIDLVGGFFCRPFGPGRTLVGVAGGDQHDPVDPTQYTKSGDETYGDLARRAIARRFPAMRDASVSHGWAGLYDMTPDTHPLIGPLGPRGLWIAAGFSGAGFKKGPAVGRALADLVLDGRCGIFDLDRFAPVRFETESWREPWSSNEYEATADFGHRL